MISGIIEFWLHRPPAGPARRACGAAKRAYYRGGAQLERRYGFAAAARSFCLDAACAVVLLGPLWSLMSTNGAIPPATLASLVPYAVPEGAKLVFRSSTFTTDGFQHGNISLILPGQRIEHIVATNVPAIGGPRVVRAVGDWGKLFPDPIQLVASDAPAR